MRTTKSIRPLILLAQSDLAIYRKYQPNRHTVSDHPRPACETPFKWRFSGGPMVVRWRADGGPLLDVYWEMK